MTHDEIFYFLCAIINVSVDNIDFINNLDALIETGESQNALDYEKQILGDMAMLTEILLRNLLTQFARSDLDNKNLHTKEFKNIINLIKKNTEGKQELMIEIQSQINKTKEKTKNNPEFISAVKTQINQFTQFKKDF